MHWTPPSDTFKSKGDLLQRIILNGDAATEPKKVESKLKLRMARAFFSIVHEYLPKGDRAHMETLMWQVI